MTQYEFTAQESAILEKLSITLKRGALLFIWAGFLTLAHGILIIITGQAGEIPLVRLVDSMTIMLIGIIFYRPTDNLHRAATTEGHDIDELMTAFKEIRSGLNLMFLVGLISGAIRLAELLIQRG